ncbi:MAG: dihydropteroate synthase [Legionellaceae bacterium]|nr:dihydropteroate synthase [Legionellaceae bacterium]
MGILNMTPDSFSDGGAYRDADQACEKALRMLAEGADIIDIGGESSRPGATPVALAVELQRVLPVISALRRQTPAMISIDTVKPEVMAEAVAAGATMVNDINALQAEGAVDCVARLGVPVCVMHRQGTAQSMQAHPAYPEGISACLQAFFKMRYTACRQAGIAAEHIIFDPGFGFGKLRHHNMSLLKDIAQITALGSPVLLGVSRKSSLGEITGAGPLERQAAGLAAAVYAVERGVAIIRTHDVAATRQALQILQAIRQTTNPNHKET